MSEDPSLAVALVSAYLEGGERPDPEIDVALHLAEAQERVAHRLRQGLDPDEAWRVAIIDSCRDVQEECAALAAWAIQEIHRLDPSRSVHDILAQLGGEGDEGQPSA